MTIIYNKHLILFIIICHAHKVTDSDGFTRHIKYSSSTAVKHLTSLQNYRLFCSSVLTNKI